VDVVWSMLVRLPGASDAQVAPMLEMARLWAAHLRGPAAHRGPVVLLSNLPDPGIDGLEVVPVQSRATTRREVFAERPRLARTALRPEAQDRYLQLDLDALARHSLEPLFRGIRSGELRVAPSMLPVGGPHHAGHAWGPVRRFWLGRVRGWDRRPGVSASVNGCSGGDWDMVMGSWAGVIERDRSRGVPLPELGDQAYLNELHGRRVVPMRRYGPGEVHHLRVDDEAPRERIDGARVLHFPLPEKLERMREWSRV
jgi:hypothetical protein